jgi:hypothetical protein
VSEYQVLSQDDEAETCDLLLGRRIVAAETGSFDNPRGWGIASGRLTLDTGTQVLVVPNDGGCSCGAGDYDLAHLAKVDNIITDVRLTVESDASRYEYDEPDQRYRIYVVADATEINVMSVDGNDGNGYYGTGYELIVVPS